MAFHVQQEESLNREQLAQLQRRKLADMWPVLLASNRFYQGKFAGLAFDPSCDSLERLPFTTRAEIQQDQADHPPYGTIHTWPPQRYNRLHQTSGTAGTPLRCLDTTESWDWWKHCWSIVYRGAGLTEQDSLMFPFSFGPFIGFWAAFDAAASLGNLCLPAGGMTTAARLRFMLDNQVSVVCCTPTYALRLAEVARDEGLDLTACPVRLLIVAGEPGAGIEAVRNRIESEWGARLIDHTGMTEIGAWGFECAENPGGVHVIESEFIAEVIDPESSRLLGDGESGELVLTNLGRLGMPLIRYRTGDRIVLTRNQCVCGRWFARAEGGIVGRIDDMLVIRGNNVFPSAIEGILRRFPDVAEFRLEALSRGVMTDLRIEVEPVDPGAAGTDTDTLADRIAGAIRDHLHFRAEVVLVQPGCLPRFEMKARRLIRKASTRSRVGRDPPTVSE